MDLEYTTPAALTNETLGDASWADEDYGPSYNVENWEGNSIALIKNIIDFSEFEELDPESDIVIDSDYVEISTMRREVSAYVKKDFGSGYFSNFKFCLDVKLDAISTSYETTNLFFGLGSNVNSFNDIIKNNCILLFGDYGYKYPVGSVPLLCLSNKNYASPGGSYQISLGTTYYCELERIDGIVTCRVYSDVLRTILLATLTVSDSGVYQFMYVALGYGLAGAGKNAITSGKISNLNRIYLSADNFYGYDDGRENSDGTSWFDECLWKSFTWDEYQDDIDEVGPDDSGEYAFP